MDALVPPGPHCRRFWESKLNLFLLNKQPKFRLNFASIFHRCFSILEPVRLPNGRPKCLFPTFSSSGATMALRRPQVAQEPPRAPQGSHLGAQCARLGPCWVHFGSILGLFFKILQFLPNFRSILGDFGSPKPPRSPKGPPE